MTTKYYLDLEGLKALIQKIVANDKAEKDARIDVTGINSNTYSAGTATTGKTDYLAGVSSLQAADRKLNDAISDVSAIASATSFKIVPAASTDAGYSADTYAGQYKLVTGDGNNITGSSLINIPKDQFLKNVKYFANSAAATGVNVTVPSGTTFPTLYFEWQLDGADDDSVADTTWVPVADLAVTTTLDEAQGENYIEVSGGTESGGVKAYTVGHTGALDNALSAGLTTVSAEGTGTADTNKYIKVSATTTADKSTGTAGAYKVETVGLDSAIANAKTALTTKARGTETTSDSDDFVVVTKSTSGADTYTVATQGIKDYVAGAVAGKNVDAEGDDYVGASAANNKVTVATNVTDVAGTKGTAGTYNATTGAQTVAPTHGTLSGTADSLMDASQAMSKVKDYVDGEVAIEAARTDAKFLTLDATVRGNLNDSDVLATQKHVGVKVVEADGKLTSVTVVEDDIASANDLAQIRTELGATADAGSDDVYTRLDALETAQAGTDTVVDGDEITWTNDSTNHTNTPVLHVDGTTITSVAVTGESYKELKSGLALDYEAAVTSGANQHAARIVLTDNQGTVLSSVDASEIIGSGVVDSSSYDASTGKLSITFVGNNTPVEIDLTALIDYNDVSVESGSTNYLQVTGITTEGSTQLQYGAKMKALAQASSGANGTGLVDAYDAKTYIDTAVAGAHTTVSGGNAAAGTINYVNVTADSNAADGHTNYAVASTQALQDALGNAKTTITTVAAASETTADGNDFIKVIKTAGSGSTADNYAISTQGIKDYVASQQPTEGTLTYSANGSSDATLTSTVNGVATTSNVASAVSDFVNGRIGEELDKLDHAAEANSTGAITPTYSGTNSDEFYVLQKVGQENGAVQACAASGTYASKSIKLKKVAATGAAADVSIADAGNKITATNVEGALQELATNIAGIEDGLKSPSVDWVNDAFDAAVANPTTPSWPSATNPDQYVHSNG